MEPADLNNATGVDPHKPVASAGFPAAYAGPALVALGGTFMLWLGWQRWADVLIDYGNQLYIPWRITQGDVLYRDLFYVFGVLSPYLHAGIFDLFGPGALHLSLFNMGLTLLLTVILYRMIRSLSGAWSATLGTLLFVMVHALGQHRYLANFNFIQPYSYDLTHGMLLAFIAWAEFFRYMKTPTTGKLIGIGLLLGLILLTKIEVMFAIGLAMAVGFIVLFLYQKISVRRAAFNILILVTAFLLPSALTLLYFSTRMPITEAIHNLLLPIQYSLHPEVKTLPYYKWIKGTDVLGENLSYIALYTAVLAGIVALLAKGNQTLDRMRKNTFPVAVSSALMLAFLLWLFFPDIPWKRFLHPLPVLMIGASLYFARRLQTNFRPHPEFFKNMALLVLSLFSLLLLVKTFFRTGIYHYGFALAFPGSLVVLLFVTDIIPTWLQQRAQSIRFYRITSTALIVSYIFVMTYDSYLYYSKKVVPVGQGVDRFYEYAPNSRSLFGRPFMEPIVTQFLLEYIEGNMEPKATFAVFPDAVMLNYLSRHKDPIQGFLLNPFTWVLVGGDQPIIQNLDNHVPDYILLIDRKYTEWRMPYFGQDFGQGIHQWIQEHYYLAKQIGAAPFTGSGFGVQIYKLKPGYDSSH